MRTFINKHILLVFIATMLSMTLVAQENSWINYNQQYFKIQIVADGMYRIYASELVSSDVPINLINANHIQIFHNGEEQYIYVSGTNSDGTLATNGYIEFYAQKNRGNDEYDFYDSPASMINPEISLYNDTAAYFLTWNFQTGNRRMAEMSENDYDNHYPNRQEYCIRQKRANYAGKYYAGNTRSFFTESEGWMDATVITASGISKTIATAGVFSSGPDTEIEFAVGGINTSNASYYNTLHQLSVTMQNQTWADTSFVGYEFVRTSFTVPNSMMTASTVLKFSSSGNETDKCAISYINIKYPHNWNFENTNSFLFTLPSNSSDSRDYIEISNFATGSGAILYDLTNHERIETTTESTTKALVAHTNTDRQMLLVGSEGYRTPAAIRKISSDNKFVNYLSQTPNADYIIVTHSKYIGVCNEYKLYRNSVGYKALVADVAQLYDQYAYGVNRNPAAIRRFCKALYESSPSEKHLLLVGRSLEASQFRSNASNAAYTTVPSAGQPASDQLFTVGICGTTVEPLFSTGRLAVTSAAQVTTYLNKVRIYESAEPALWNKEVMHFGGGNNISEQSRIEYYLDSYKEIIEDTLFGGHTHTFLKNSSAAVTTTNSDSIDNLINDGISMMLFFGHGSSTSFDHEIKSPEFYNNEGKYPFMIGNSCYVGAIHSTSNTLSDVWIKAQKGAIGFMSSMDQGNTSYLHTYTHELYKNIAYDRYSQPIGLQIKNTLKNVLSNSWSINTDITSYQITLHGDPAIIVGPKNKPDLMIDNSSISISPQEVTTVLDSFDVNVDIKNFGKAVSQNFLLYVERTLPDGTETHYETIVDGCLYRRTASVKIPTNIIDGSGMNHIRVYVDGMNEIDESSETNNYATFDFMIRSSDIFPIHPYEYAIYPYDTVSLIASTGDPFLTTANYHFQIDTTDRFNSPLMRETTVNSAGGIVKWTLPFILTENTVYYWRVSAELENGEYSWKESSFIYIDGEEGWSQAHYYQFKKDRFNFIEYNRNTQVFTYSQGQKQLNCHNRANVNSSTFDVVRWSIDNTIGQQSGGYSNCNQGSAMVAVVIDPMTILAWQSNRQNYGHRNYPKCSSSSNPQPYFTFDISTNALNGMNNLINDVPNGYYILIYSWRGVSFSSLPETLKQTLESLGSIYIRSVPNNKAYIFCTKKGTPSVHREIFGDDIDMDPLNLVTDLTYGYITSTVVGPSMRWRSLQWQHESESGDELKLEVYGIRPSGEEELVIDSIGANVPLLSALDNLIDYRTYPNLRLNLFTRDTVNHTTPQLKKWQLRFDGVPETAIDPKLGYFFHSDTIERGDELVFAISTRNVSNYDMDSLVVKYWIRDSRNNETLIDIHTLRPHPAHDIISDTIRYSTLGLSGLNSIWVEFNPINETTGTYYQPEQYHYNNIASKYFYISTDNTNPLLEVSFDGKFIMNGEIVSAKPEILITLKDENKYLALNDTSVFDMHLTNLTTGQAKRINFGIQENPAETIEWIPAELPDNSCKIIYNPIFTEDGTYRLQVQAKDASGNLSGDNCYVIDFTIITKSTITNLLNYPNPFSSQTRFVFELTGSEIPDELEIEIFTITGKIVKRIYLEELGPITIGRNITEYAWDGCDTYGDRLANGVYFYTVRAKINGEEIEKRDVGTDKYFKREVGKMYILR
ncbi:MAG: hypothetical protein J6T48_00180 [Bacteroidales bacterium]|nr:hypothetical protein [Bacteroidales bacterium]